MPPKPTSISPPQDTISHHSEVIDTSVAKRHISAPKPQIPPHLHVIDVISSDIVKQWVFANGDGFSRMTGFGRVRSENQRGLQRTRRDVTGTKRAKDDAHDNVESRHQDTLETTFDDSSTIEGSQDKQSSASSPLSSTPIQHPRTGARLFLLRNYSHHLAVNNLTSHVVLTSRTFRKIREFTYFEITAMLQQEEAEFIKDLYLRKHKHRASESEELWIRMSAHPLVRWALDFDEREVGQLFEAAFEGNRVPIEKQLVDKYRSVQERGSAKSRTRSPSRKSRIKSSQNTEPASPAQTIPTWRSIVTPSSTTRPKVTPATKYYLKQAQDESSHSFVQRIIENERMRRLNILSNAKPDLRQLRDPKLFERRVAEELPLQQVYDNETLSDFRALAKRLNQTYKIADVGDKVAALHATQNIKLMRVEKKVPVGKLDWDKTCCFKRTQAGSYVKSRNSGGDQNSWSDISEPVNRFLASMDDLYGGVGI